MFDTVVLDGYLELNHVIDGECGAVIKVNEGAKPAYTGPTEITPTQEIQTLSTAQKTVLVDIIVNPVPGDYVGSDIPRRDGDDMTASGATVTAPAGYYEESASKTVQSGTEGTPSATKGAVSNHSVSVTPSVTNVEGYIDGGTKTGTPVTVTAEELESGTKSITENGTGIDVTGYAEVDVEVPSIEPVLQTVSKTYNPSTSQQTETVTASAGYDGIEQVNVTVNPMPTGTAGTPTASKGTVSNHSVAVTPSVTNSTGYIEGGTKTGEPVTVTASELESGTKSITENGEGIDVTGYAAVDVDVPSSEPTLQTITKTYTPSTSQQTETVTASAGYDGIKEVDITVNAMPTGTAMESGSFIATRSRNITLSVTKLYSHVYVWAADIKGDDDISGNPYGNRKVFSFAADNNTGFYFIGGTYNGTSFAGYFGGIGRWGGVASWSNLVQFTASTIIIQSMTMGGGNGETIAGKTYNWIAW